MPGLHLEYYDYFFEEMQKDFDEVPAKPSELILYTYDKVKQYLTHVEEICVREVQNLLAGREILDAREYFVGERRCDRIS